MPGFDAYTADASMYEVHKFMALDANEVGYFITQVGLAASVSYNKSINLENPSQK